MKKLLLILLFPTLIYAQPVSSLPAASTLGGTEVMLGVQSATSKKISVNQVKTYVLSGNTTLAAYGIADAQPLDADLTAIAGLSPSNTDMISRQAGAWVVRTLAQVRTDLALVTQTITNGVTDKSPSEDKVFDELALKSALAGSSNIVTTGTLTSGATGAGFTLNFSTSTISGALPAANIPAMYVLDLATPSTAGGTITLDMNSQKQRLFAGSASFSTPKIIAMSNTTNAQGFGLAIDVTSTSAVITVPADWIMYVDEFNGTTWTPPTTGVFELGGTWYGTFWSVKIVGPGN